MGEFSLSSLGLFPSGVRNSIVLENIVSYMKTFKRGNAILEFWYVKLLLPKVNVLQLLSVVT